MQEPTKYVIFKTRWGHFGLAGTESALCRTYLPEPKPASLRRRLLEHSPGAEFEEEFFKPLQKQITVYFDGEAVDFSRDIPVDLNGFSIFSRKILGVCRNLKLGQTVTYSELALRSGYPSASRAVGGVLARNPLPLIIPCHRVIRTDGQMGGFSAPGGVSLKKRMLDFERQAIHA